MHNNILTLTLVNMSLERDHSWRVTSDKRHLFKDYDINTKISPFILYNVQSKEEFLCSLLKSSVDLPCLVLLPYHECGPECEI